MLHFVACGAVANVGSRAYNEDLVATPQFGPGMSPWQGQGTKSMKVNADNAQANFLLDFDGI